MFGSVWCGFGGVSVCFGMIDRYGFGEVSLCCVRKSMVLVWWSECVLCMGQFGVGLWSECLLCVGQFGVGFGE